jgi:outer membrane protein OmpA-like peptidoglycan-associated protein
MKAAVLLLSCALPAVSQQQSGSTPIYEVTVVERTVKAVNYQYRSEPTMIDFRGTVLLPKAKGEAMVQSKQGRTEIDVKFEKLTEPQRYGVEYLTFVLWALTPDGRPHNIGEVVAGPREHAHLRVTTDMQAFAMIVTAEPYSAVRQPSDVVVLENVIRPDTQGKIEQVEAKYELLPRKSYSLHLSDQQAPFPGANAPKVSMRQYEALSELYQAQSAVETARAASADRYAVTTFSRAQQLLVQAQQIEAGKKEPSRVVEIAREAAQTAEDARVIAAKHQQEEKISQSQAEAKQARQALMQAEQEVRNARADAEAERAARQQASADAAAARQRTGQPQTAIPRDIPPALPQNDAARKSAQRVALLEQLRRALPTRDTPRGLVSTLADAEFAGVQLRPGYSNQLVRIAQIVAANPGLRIEVEGYTDSPDMAALSQRRADAVRAILISHGAPPSMISARGLSNSRPLASSRTPAGREENQRVELVIAGDSIGNLPTWDRTYALKSH